MLTPYWSILTNSMIYDQLVNKEKKLALIGLGYVGLPIALAFARKISVIGFDINRQRVEMMKNGIDPSNELEAADFAGCDIEFTDSLEVLKEASFYIVAVPTPVDEHKVPDLTPVQRASETVGKVLKKGDYVVFESTVYPGCTEEDCLPIMERISGLKMGVDFKLGYSPERINPGDKVNTLTKIKKVTSGSTPEIGKEIVEYLNEVAPYIINPETTKIMEEGVDIKALDTIILATPKKKVVQSCGRILRKLK